MQLRHDVVCPTLVGRDAEIDAVRSVLDRARAGHGQVALIVGEAGVGKSRLLRAMTDEARRSGFFTMHGSSYESDSSVPYAPLLDLVRLFAESASPALVAHVLGPAASELVTLFPELHPLLPDATPSPTSDPDTDKRRLFHALARTITLLSHTQPVFLAVEDVHWCDDATLDLVFHLARSHAAQPVVIVLTYRNEEVGPRLARLIEELERARLVTELPMKPLRRDEVRAMLDAIFGPRTDLGDEFVELIHGLTEGNPFFVEETLKALMVAGDLVPRDGGWRAQALERVRVPRTAIEAVRRRIATLTVPARSVASIAAVTGRRFDFELLRTLTDMDEEELLALVKELIAAQLVVEETGERFAFRHALTREAIYADLLVRERIALHRAVASALERAHAGAPESIVEALAYHAWEAGEWARAADYAARAARHAMALSAPREAVAQLDRAFQASEKAGTTVSVELLLARGWANETLAEFDRAREDFTSALDRARAAGDRSAAWEALHALGMLWAARDYSRAGDYRRDALTVARAIGDDALVARSLNRVGNWHVNLDDPRAGLPHHEEALALFERLGDQRGVAETVDLLAMAHHIAGDQRAAATYFERSIALFTASDDRRGLANALGLLVLCGPSHHVAATTPFATTKAQDEIVSPQSLRLAREIGWRAGESFVRFLIGDALAWRGEYDRALPMAREARELAEQIGHLQWIAASRRLLGSLLLDLCAPELAREQLEAANEIARVLGSRVWIRWIASPLAMARMQTSDLAGAEALLDDAAHAADGASAAPGAPLNDGTTAIGDATAGPSSPTFTLGERQLWLARAALALAATQPARALEIADARLAVERAANPHSVLGVPRLTIVRAEALLALERFDEATAALDVAREEATRQGARPLLWRIEAVHGQVHRAQRQRLEARQAFDRATAIAEELAQRIEDDELRAGFLSGVAEIVPPAPTPSAARIAKAEADGLTRRERDVARLVALGKANKVIAHDLGIGERTVEGYVASALAKLGFDSRARLAAWAVTKGLAEPARPVPTPRAD